MIVDEIGAHLGVRRLRSMSAVNNHQLEDDASYRRRVESEIANRQRQGGAMPVAAKSLTTVQEAIKQTILEVTAARDDVPLEEILLAFGTPSGELKKQAPAVIGIMIPILRRLVLDGVISIRPDERPRGKLPKGVEDPLEGNHWLVSRVRLAPVAPKTHDAIDLVYVPSTDVAYIRAARISYDGIAAGVLDGSLTRIQVPGETIALDFDPEGGLVGVLLTGAGELLTQDTLDTATIING